MGPPLATERIRDRIHDKNLTVLRRQNRNVQERARKQLRGQMKLQLAEDRQACVAVEKGGDVMAQTAEPATSSSYRRRGRILSSQTREHTTICQAETGSGQRGTKAGGRARTGGGGRGRNRLAR